MGYEIQYGGMRGGKTECMRNTFKKTGTIFCAHCGGEIKMGEHVVFSFGKNYHRGCEIKAILGEDE